ncbi:hypothetical protein B0H13DRAFT_1882387 [Mycena leptocephala]|nr:hypothetical protein B0H13DRAFT_1882387 [Mycena leptocephala]
MTVALWREGREDTFTQGQGFGKASDAVIDAKRQHKKELARARKQKERTQIKKMEIARGERSPGDSKKRKNEEPQHHENRELIPLSRLCRTYFAMDEDADGPGFPDDDDDNAEQPDSHFPHTPDAPDVESEDEEDGPPESDEGDDENEEEEEEEKEKEDGDFGPEDGKNGEDDLTVQLGYDEL